MTLSPLLLSFAVAGGSTLLVIAAGLPLARWLSTHRGGGARFLDALATAPLVLPPVVTGFYLLSLFSPSGPVGRLLEMTLGASVVFHWTGAVLASAVVSFPLMVRSARAALESVPERYLEAARSCGAHPTRVFLRVQLPLALPGVAAGVVLAFARGLGEFGATVIVAGNIPGRTQTLPLAIYEAIISGQTARANALALVITGISVVLLFLADRFQQRAQRRGLRSMP